MQVEWKTAVGNYILSCEGLRFLALDMHTNGMLAIVGVLHQILMVLSIIRGPAFIWGRGNEVFFIKIYKANNFK